MPHQAAHQVTAARASTRAQMRLRPPKGIRLPALATEFAFWTVCASDGHAALGCRDITGASLGEVFRLELVEEGSMETPPLEPQPNVWDEGRAELHTQQARGTAFHSGRFVFAGVKLLSNMLFRVGPISQAQRRDKELVQAASQSPALLRAPSAPLPATSASSVAQASLSRGASVPSESSGGEGGPRCVVSLSRVISFSHHLQCTGTRVHVIDECITCRFGLGLANRMKKLATDVSSKMDNATAAMKLKIASTLNREQDLVRR